LAALLNRILIPLIRFVVQRLTAERDDRQLARVAGPVRLFTVVSTFHAVMSVLALPLLVRLFWAGLTATLDVIAVTWLIIRIIDILAELAGRHLERINRPDGTAVLGLLSRLSKAVIVTLGGLFLLYLAGVDLTPAIAGLGVGGIAVAFAAQKTLENLFGGIMISSDRPVRVGDFCRVGDCLGTIEDIGLRSTRIRTLDRTVVSVPNGQLAAMSLENFSHREKIWFHPKLRLRCETSADQLRYVLAEIRRLLYEHPKVETGSARIRFVGFGNSSLDLEIFAYVPEADYGRFLEIQEDLLLRMMDVVEQSGTGFAFPCQTTYIARDPGLDHDKSQAAMAQVRLWRERRDLPFPDYPPERIAEMENRLEYPPPESAHRRQER
jgi:MscS family membrane protein